MALTEKQKARLKAKKKKNTNGKSDVKGIRDATALNSAINSSKATLAERLMGDEPLRI